MKINRVAVIADIHANMYALNTFMEYLNARPEIETVLNIGDFLQFGPSPAEVFDIVMNDRRFINVLGNNEIELFEDLEEEEHSERAKHMLWTKSTIGEERLSKLKQLPKSKAVELFEKRFMLVHTVTESYVDMNELAGCEYVLMGHTHQQSFGSYWKEKRVMNPGSIGYTPGGIVNFGVIEIGGGITNFLFKNMRYNNLMLKDELIKRNVPGASRIINYLMSSVE